jgi:hypothetical protein
MFLTGAFPLFALALPIFSGMLVAVVAVEINKAWGFVTYAAVAVLSVFVTPDKQSAVFFIMFFGYYPILKLILEAGLKKLKIIQWLVKLAVFNAAIISAYYVIISVLGLVDLFAEFGFTGDYLVAGLILFGNLVFILYDITFTLLMITYQKWFRPTFLRKIK